MRRTIRVFRLGRIAYGRALAIQEHLQAARSRGEIPDTLLLLEHDPVITIGRATKAHHLRARPELFAARGIELFEIGRGGSVTYHGPGQLVGYPILDLSPDRRDVRRYVGDLEEIMIRVCGHWGLRVERIAGLNGAWLRDAELGDRKIGAVGVRISRWVTMHGFALNVNLDLSPFSLIVPCGIADKGVTSLARELGRPVSMEEVLDACERSVAEVFDAELVRGQGDPLSEIAIAAARK